MNHCVLLVSLALLALTNPGADAITCYTRTATSSGTCISTSATTCYQYSSWGITYGGCGTCASQSNPSGCSECSTDHCNTATSLSNRVCFSRDSSASSTGNGTFVTCATGTVCYEAFDSGTNYAGCGSCRTPNTYCRTCNINFCNTREYSGGNSAGSLHGWRVRVTAAAAAAVSTLALMMKPF